MPLRLVRPAMVTSPTGKGVIVMGGYSFGEYSKTMFELSQSMEWTRLEQTLQIGHLVPLAIPIPVEFVHESSQPLRNSREQSYLSVTNIIPNKRRRIVKHKK